MAVQRPRVRAADGSGELPVAAYELFSGTELLGRLALERMLGGLSTRRYPLGLEPVGTQVAQAASGTSKSAVSRRFVAMTHTALAELLTRDLSTLDLVWLLIDGVHFAEHTCVVALGIAIDGTKHPLALVEGCTENATLARELLVGCASVAWRSPGRSCASSTAPRRCAARSPTCSTTRSSPEASSTRSATSATSCPNASAARSSTACAPPTTPHPPWTPRPSCSPGPGTRQDPPRRRRVLTRGLAETLTVLRLGVPPTLARTLRSTNPIESMISICREHAGNVKRWQDGTMALRWCAAGMVEAAKQFRRVNGYLHLPALRTALDAEVAKSVTGSCEDQEQVEAA